MKAKVKREYDRIKNGPHKGEFSFLHHRGPIAARSENVMERVRFILKNKSSSTHYTRLRHIIFLDPDKIPAMSKRKQIDDYYRVKRKLLDEDRLTMLKQFDEEYLVKRKQIDDEIVMYVRSQIREFGWDGETIFSKKKGSNAS